MTTATLLDGRRAIGVVADKAYNNNALRQLIAKTDMAVVIPSKADRKAPIAHDTKLYEALNRIEQCFNKLKRFRRFATR